MGAHQDLANDGDHDRVARYRDGIVLLAFRDGTEAAQQKTILSSLGAREIKRIGVGVHVVSVKPGQVLAAIRSLKALEAVRYAEPDYLQTLSASGLPNDTFVGSQWAVQNTGQSVNGTSGKSGADERSLAAWGITTGTNSVVIAELDTGVQYSHPDLFTNMWNNPGGIGGCSAGTHGYNVLSSSCDPMDDDSDYGGHGTHVAGIMGAIGNNAAGTAGVNWTTSIMAIKWVNSGGTGATSDLITGMDWVVSAKQSGINLRVANDSQTWPGTAFSQALSDEIDLLGSNDILFVTASGNTAQNNDSVPRYPCSYQRPTMICAAASDQNDNLWSSANYGPKSDQLAAPGVNIYSTLRVSNYGYISGGSMASPQVAGTAALILSLGYQSVSNLRSMILNNVDVLSSLSGLVGTGGRLNVCKAVPGCSTAIAAKPAISIFPVVTSIPVQGGLLGASTGAWTGVPSTYTYQWGRCDQNGLNCSPIPGATGQTYAPLAPADALATLAVTVTASNTIGSSSAQSSASSAVAAATSSSAINSSIASGATLSGSANWTVTPSRSEQFVQFYIDGVLTETDSASPYVFTSGSSGSLDTTTLSNGSHVLGVRALYTDNRTYDFYGETVTVSNVPQNTSLPQISGTILSGQTLSTTNGSWNPNAVPTSYSYQWEHCDSNGLNCSTITGAIAPTYLLSAIDGNFTIRSAVTASNSAGPTVSVSAQTTVVPPPVGFSISTTTLPNGTQNMAYSATLAATGGTLPYTWSITSGSLPTGLTLIASTGAITGTPTGSAGTSNVTVQVSDANSLTATKALALTVVLPPAVSSTSLSNGTQNVAYSATLAATGGTLPYTWSITSGSLSAGLTLTASTGAISGTPTGTGTSNFTVQVSDANSVKATKALALTVVAPPAISTTSLPNGTQTVAYSATLAATGGTSPYTWSITSGSLPSGLTLTASTGAISGTPTGTGISNFTVQVSDTNSLTASKSLSVTINAAGGGGGIGLVQENAVQGSGVGSLSVAFPAANTAANLILAFVRMSTTTQTVTLKDSAGNTYIQAVAQVQNSDGSQIRLFYAKNILGAAANTVTATFSASNNHPWLAIYEYSGLSTTSPLDQTASAQGNSAGPSSGATPVTTSANELVFGGAGLASSYSGTQTAGSGFNLLEGDTASSPAATEVMMATSTATYTASLTLSGSANWSAVIATFASGAPVGPNVTTTSLPNGTQNASYSATLAASGGTLPYTWSVTSGTLPTGLTLTASTGAISGTPTGSAGTSNFTVQVSDANSLKATKVLTLTVVPPPTVSTTSLPNGTQNGIYGATLAATGGTLPYTWSITSGSLPTGLTLTPSTGTISGTPTGTGTSNFTVQASDANSQTASAPLSLTVAATPTVTTASLPNGTQNAGYSAMLAAAGGTLPYTWSITSGTLPTGLTLTPSTGAISGTPTGSTGTSNFTVQVADGNSLKSTKALTLTVVALPAISTTSLPNGTQNAAYSATLAASGGTLPYTWSITSGTLPAGLTLTASTGAISGTPTGTGTSNFTVQVSDANSVTASKSLSVTINAAGGGGGIGLVQENAVPGAGVGSLSVAFPAANTAGNLILAFVRLSTTTQTVTLKDSAGNTYIQAVAQVQTADGSQVRLFYAKNILGAAANTVTATFSASNNHPWLAIYEYSGLSTTSPLDQTASAQGNSAAPSSGATPVTTGTNELVFGAIGLPSSFAGTQTAGSGYALLEVNSSGSRGANESELVTSTGAYTASFTLSGSVNWSVLVATFKQ